tara:strand:+ start:54 stop:338 length:285 start_codon:yes stop_codon:yes gene_type:complete
MNYENLYTTIISEPIYLTLVIIFILIIIYSILKKFFKLLMFVFISLVIYISFQIYTDGDLPGESEEIIFPLIDEASKAIKDLSNQLQDKSNTKE